MTEVVLEAICRLLAMLFELGLCLPPLKPRPGKPSVSSSPAKKQVVLICQRVGRIEPA